MTVTILTGDVFDRLADLPADHFHCVVTSPPYWGLRDYGVEGQFGLEPTLGEHLDAMVGVFREVRRVLRPDGTLWVNYGDCYATAPNGRSAAATKAHGGDDRTFRDKPFSTVGPIYSKSKRIKRGSGRWGGGNNSDPMLKPKDLCMIPNRLAIALQEDGWWVRSENVWGKANAMPDSVRDRPGTAHEKVFMLSRNGDAPLLWRARDTEEWSGSPDLTERCENWKGEPVNRWQAYDYYYDRLAVRQERSGNTHSRGTKRSPPIESAGVGHKDWCSYMRPDDDLVDREQRKKRASTPRHEGHIQHTRIDATPRGEGRYLRNWEPAPPVVWEIPIFGYSEAHFATFPPELAERCILAGCPEGGHVLDPFGGSGTVGAVAHALGRDATLIELNPDYVEIARRRCGLVADTPLDKLKRKARAGDAGPLFQEASS